MRRTLKNDLDSFGGTSVFVTHDPLEAGIVGDTIVILEDGRVTHSGTYDEISAAPRSDYAAALLGTNLIRGSSNGSDVTTSAGARLAAVSPPVGDVFAAIEPHSIALFDTHPHGSPRNVWDMKIVHLEATGPRVRIAMAGPLDLVAEVTPAAVSELDLAPGRRVWAAAKASDVRVYPV